MSTQAVAVGVANLAVFLCASSEESWARRSAAAVALSMSGLVFWREFGFYADAALWAVVVLVELQRRKQRENLRRAATATVLPLQD